MFIDPFAARGAYPRWLLAIGLRDYREIFFKPYRIIYRVVANQVYFMVVADGRRDMQTLLQRRLVEAWQFVGHSGGGSMAATLIRPTQKGASDAE